MLKLNDSNFVNIPRIDVESAIPVETNDLEPVSCVDIVNKYGKVSRAYVQLRRTPNKVLVYLTVKSNNGDVQTNSAILKFEYSRDEDGDLKYNPKK